MIYIITPYWPDVVKTCQKENIPCFVKAGRLLNDNIFWVYDWLQLLGRIIFKTDLILYGEKANEFDPELYKRICDEIELRKRI